MDKPNNHSTLKYMREYIKNKKLNEKPIKLNFKRAETIDHLKKLGHWDSSVDNVKKPKKTDGVDKAKGTSKKRVTVGKEEAAKKRLDEYVKLHTLYIKNFDDAGLKKYNSVATAKSDSDKLLKRMADLVEPIAQSLILDYIKKTKGVTKARATVKSLSNSLEERFEKLPKKKKTSVKEDEVRPVDKDVPKIKKKPPPPVKKAPPPAPPKADDTEIPDVEVSIRKQLASDYFRKYNKTIYQALKPFNENMSSEGKAKNLTRAEIKKTGKRIRLKLHPDKGGSAEEFSRVFEAISIIENTLKSTSKKKKPATKKPATKKPATKKPSTKKAPAEKLTLTGPLLQTYKDLINGQIEFYQTQILKDSDIDPNDKDTKKEQREIKSFIKLGEGLKDGKKTKGFTPKQTKFLKEAIESLYNSDELLLERATPEDPTSGEYEEIQQTILNIIDVAKILLPRFKIKDEFGYKPPDKDKLVAIFDKYNKSI